MHAMVLARRFTSTKAVGLAVALLLVLFAPSCGDDDVAGPTLYSETAGGPCAEATPIEPGEYLHTRPLETTEQRYWVQVPPAYDGVTPIPVLLWIPGSFGGADAALAGAGPFQADASELVVFVDVSITERRSLDAIDDLIDELAGSYCVDLDRVYVTGTSANAGLTSTIASDLPDRIAAAVIGIGSFRPGPNVSSPVPMLAWTGDVDRPQVTSSVEAWAEVNGCDPEPTRNDLGAGVTHVEYTGCSAPLELYDFAGMGHQVPETDCSIGDPRYGEFCAEYTDFDFNDLRNAFYDRLDT